MGLRRLLALIVLIPAAVHSGGALAAETLVQRLKSKDPTIARPAVEEVLAHPERASPGVLAATGLALFRMGEKDTGTFWYLAAVLRGKYQPRPELGIPFHCDTGFHVPQEIGAYGAQEKQRWIEAIARARDWDEQSFAAWLEASGHASLTAEMQECRAQFRQFYAGIRARALADMARLERQEQLKRERRLTEEMKSCDPKRALAAAEEIIANPSTLKEPLQLIPAAWVLFQQDRKDDAVFWFYAAQLRVRYQLAFEKGDRGQLLTIMLTTVGTPVNNYAYQDVPNLDRILDRVMEWDEKTPNPFRERAKSREVEQRLDQMYAGLRALKAKLASEKDDLERKARLAAPEIQRAYTRRPNPACREGEPDPADASRMIEEEKSSVINFARTSQEVLRESGGIRSLSIETWSLKKDSALPHRYVVSVNGHRGWIFAVVDVARSQKDAAYTLACMTRLSMGRRDPFKDVCEQ